jgi:hypothetical protein
MTAQERLSQVANHMSGGTGSSSGSAKKGKAALLEKNPDDVSVPTTPRKLHDAQSMSFVSTTYLQDHANNIICRLS